MSTSCNKGRKTKNVRGTDLNSDSFLFLGIKTEPRSWLLPVFDPTSMEKTQELIKRSIAAWPRVSRYIPIAQHAKVATQLRGAAMSWGITVQPGQLDTDLVAVCLNETALSADEMSLLAQRAADDFLTQLDTLYAYYE